MPVIEAGKCNGCGLCVSVCACNVLVLVNNVVTYIQKEGCVGCSRWCGQCEVVCPNEAITCPFEVIVEEK